MPRNPDAVGVGRGNGPGSRGGQFGYGQPSNLGGRKPKPKKTASSSMDRAFQRVMAEPVRVRVGDRFEEMSRYDVLARETFELMGDADLKERLAFIRSLARVPMPVAEPEPVTPKRAAHDLVAALAARQRELVAREDELRQRGADIPNDRPPGMNMRPGMWKAWNPDDPEPKAETPDEVEGDGIGPRSDDA